MDFFPYTKERKGQELIIEYIERVLKNKDNLLINAPTGIGKTAAALAPSLNYSISNKKKLFFLTSRQTQHTIAISTVKAIAKKIKKD
ncbi:MAG: excision repair protein, partial [Candidatus Woesearchaeota archaeon]|nr:excision repair protein [Candidatus Woesearchaeota archaeon]